MLLYWGMFTAGFIIGAMLAYGLFGIKEPEEEIKTANKGFNSENVLELKKKGYREIMQNAKFRSQNLN